MRTEYRLFGVVALFLFVAAAVYALVDRHGEPGRVEWVGTVALVLSGLLCPMCGGFFWFVVAAHRPAPGGPRRTPRSPTAPARSASSARAATGRSASRWRR